MKISTYDNRTTVTFNIQGIGSRLAEKINPVYKITDKHNAQVMLFSNVSPWKYDKKGNIIGEQLGDTGGTITFHSHSCEHSEAANELVTYLKSL